ncbi:MAG: alpha-L-fucosidase, partial [Terriglobales bacterium]
GLYLSPWDRHEASYGDSPRYNDFYCGQLTELLTGYGPIAEVRFDGANGEDANGKKVDTPLLTWAAPYGRSESWLRSPATGARSARGTSKLPRQVYDWGRIWALVRSLQPEALIFSDAGPDIRWIGNERGYAGDPNWAAVDPLTVPYPGASGAAVSAMLQHGDARGAVWRPAEADVSLRPGWFYHAAEDAKLKSVDELVAIYLNSVGRNAKLLLNVPPAPSGLIAHGDVDRLVGFQSRLGSLLGMQGFSVDFARWTAEQDQLTGAEPRAATTLTGMADLGGAQRVVVVDLAEQVEQGQRIARYRLDGQGEDGRWQELCSGTTIGVRRLQRLAQPAVVRKLQITLESDIAAPLPARCALHFD